jgi:hypothetical protein
MCEAADLGHRRSLSWSSPNSQRSVPDVRRAGTVGARLARLGAAASSAWPIPASAATVLHRQIGAGRLGDGEQPHRLLVVLAGRAW